MSKAKGARAERKIVGAARVAREARGTVDDSYRDDCRQREAISIVHIPGVRGWLTLVRKNP
jgi:hypothetical protein